MSPFSILYYISCLQSLDRNEKMFCSNIGGEKLPSYLWKNVTLNSIYDGKTQSAAEKILSRDERTKPKSLLTEYLAAVTSSNDHNEQFNVLYHSLCKETSTMYRNRTISNSEPCIWYQIRFFQLNYCPTALLNSQVIITVYKRNFAVRPLLEMARTIYAMSMHKHLNPTKGLCKDDDVNSFHTSFRSAFAYNANTVQYDIAENSTTSSEQLEDATEEDATIENQTEFYADQTPTTTYCSHPNNGYDDTPPRLVVIERALICSMVQVMIFLWFLRGNNFKWRPFNIWKGLLIIGTITIIILLANIQNLIHYVVTIVFVFILACVQLGIVIFQRFNETTKKPPTSNDYYGSKVCFVNSSTTDEMSSIIVPEKDFYPITNVSHHQSTVL